MKRLTLYALLISAVAFTAACGNKKEETGATAEEWPAMDAFHMIMAESFHPFKDSANLEPAKENAVAMAKAADEWANAPLPDKVNTDETKADLAQLKADSEAFIEIAQTGDSTQIGTSLTSLHDRFHKLQEAWYGGKGHDEAGHKH